MNPTEDNFNRNFEKQISRIVFLCNKVDAGICSSVELLMPPPIFLGVWFRDTVGLVLGNTQ